MISIDQIQELHSNLRFNRYNLKHSINSDCLCVINSECFGQNMILNEEKSSYKDSC